MPEQDPSRFESLKQNINRLKAIGEITALGLGATLGLVAVADAEQPVAYGGHNQEALSGGLGPSIKTTHHNKNTGRNTAAMGGVSSKHSSKHKTGGVSSTEGRLANDENPEATISSLKQECIKEGLTRPEIEEATVFRAGKYLRQVNVLKEDFKPLSEKCDGKFELSAVGMFQAKGSGDSKWRSLSGDWVTINNINTHVAGFTELPSIHEPRDADYYVKHGERARVLEKSRVVNKNGKVVAEKTFAIKAKISHKKGHIVI